jgi:type VI secretion system secreted protein VgrG
MAYTQDNRFIGIDTPLGKDVLLLSALTGSEGISRLFNFELDLLSENSSISFDQIVGQKVTIRINLADSKRYINGYVSRFAQAGSDFRLTHYRMEVVPWLWFLTRRANCRIFQNQKISDIIKKIFSSSAYSGISEFKIEAQDNSEPREYCVQYRETDFNFVSRLMEQYGFYYFFEHSNGKHTLIVANSSSSHKPCPGQTKARYDYTVTAYEHEDVVTAWETEQELRTGKYALTDYNFETPSTSLAVNESTTINVDGNSRYEIFDFPGEYAKKGGGQSLVRLRMEEEETPGTVISGASICRAFTSGYKFDLTDHYRKDQNKSYVLIEVRHSMSVGAFYETGEGTERCSNQFTCIAHSTPFRPARMTPKPVVQGPQTAVVVGKSGEEIWVDKYGRVKVQFHWDREGKWDENSSCWVRVAQNWAGKRWGAIFIPRIGQEVIIDFLEGDPDQPIITGRVYNAEEMPPYTLPDEQTKSTIKTNSSKGGSGFNEIRFEDKKGSEQIFIHGEKDVDIRIKNDEKEWIGNDRHVIVQNDHMEKIANNMSIQIGNNLDEKSGMKFAHEAGMEIHLKAGMKVIIEATQVSLKGAGGFVDVGPAGVTIQGTMVLINSGGAAGVGSGASPKDPKEADDDKAGSVDQVPKRDPREKF